MVYAAAESRPGRVAEHWNWSQDSRKTIPVDVYTNCDSAELFLNGRSLGEKPVANRQQPVLRWDVPNEPGTVRVLAKRDGVERARFELATAGAPDHLELRSEGSGLLHIEIRVTDAAGRRVFAADAPIEVQVTGSAELVALDSGNMRDLTPVQSSRRNAYEGRILAIVRPGSDGGPLAVHASAPGLKPGEFKR